MPLTALITGATSTLGEAFARTLSSRDIKLVLTGRREDRLHELAETIPGVTSFIACDLTKDISTLMTHTEETSIDILINNAGSSRVSKFYQMPKARIEEQMALNILSLTRLCRHFLPPMVERGHGRILNVASIAAFHPFPVLSVYAASKAYVLSLSESLSEECRGSGIFITCLCPGGIDTVGQTADTHLDVPEFTQIDAQSVATLGIEAMMKGDAICVPDKTQAAAVAVTQHQPRWLMRRLTGIATRLARRH
ncbi:MAG: SDR family NAD(P)-dependent oxidoreductase [Pseudomonadota bacterium]|nr:SDR family NAD(P)-dependent oxidoreductase [Pseudomonadota bacterium]